MARELPSQLDRRDTIPVPDHAGEIRLFCVVQNEALRLPDFFRHYRQLGVTRFFMIDNASTDATASIISDKPDTHHFYTAHSFAAANYGLLWQQELLSQFGIGYWCLIVDADELLVYPQCETTMLPALCTTFQANNIMAMQTILLDMYSDQPITNLTYQATHHLMTTCPYFDQQYQFTRRVALPWEPPPFPPTEPVGGPRARLFYPWQYRGGLALRLAIKLLYRALHPLAHAGLWPTRWLPHAAPQLFKIPLIHWQADHCLVTSHRIKPLRLAQTTGALLHFKFLQDFSERINAAITHGQHYDGSIEYMRYGAVLAQQPSLSFFYAGSRRYQHSNDIVQAGLMQSGHELLKL